MATSTLTLNPREVPNGPKIVEMTGNLNLETVSAFNHDLRDDSSPALLLDFTNVVWFDSAGVGALVHLLVRRAKVNHTIALAGLSARNRAVLEVAQVLKLFKVYPTVGDAEKSFAASGSF